MKLTKKQLNYLEQIENNPEIIEVIKQYDGEILGKLTRSYRNILRQLSHTQYSDAVNSD